MELHSILLVVSVIAAFSSVVTSVVGYFSYRRNIQSLLLKIGDKEVLMSGASKDDIDKLVKRLIADNHEVVSADTKNANDGAEPRGIGT